MWITDTGDLELAKFIIENSKLDEKGCWVWQKYKDRDGYGHVGGWSEWYKKYRKQRSHQLSLIAFIGIYEPSYFVLHLCNNSSCVNPAHLCLGTHQENMEHVRKAGTQKGRYGAQNNASKLTQDQVDFLRQGHPGYTISQLAKEWKLWPKTLSNAKKGLSWKT